MDKARIFELAAEADFLITCKGTIETQNSYGECTKEVILFAELIIEACARRLDNLEIEGSIGYAQICAEVLRSKE